jgi:hypothetical protein
VALRMKLRPERARRNITKQFAAAKANNELCLHLVRMLKRQGNLCAQVPLPAPATCTQHRRPLQQCARVHCHIPS